jgi:hypothetical protein
MGRVTLLPESTSAIGAFQARRNDGSHKRFRPRDTPMSPEGIVGSRRNRRLDRRTAKGREGTLRLRSGQALDACTLQGIPRGLKPNDLGGVCGTTEVVPFQSRCFILRCAHCGQSGLAHSQVSEARPGAPHLVRKARIWATRLKDIVGSRQNRRGDRRTAKGLRTFWVRAFCRRGERGPFD